jgi:hypothetical protein
MASSKFDYRVETVTPAKAAKWLATSPGNRNIRASRVALYSRLIERNEFRVTHQGIAFDSTGRLRDGHHRLTAIAAGTKPVAIAVYRGLTDDDLQVIDKNAARSTADSLKIAGIENADATTIATASVFRLAPKIGYRIDPFTDKELIEFMTRHQDAISYGRSCTCGNRRNSILSGACARAYYHTSECQRERIREILNHGASIEPTSADRSIVKVRDLFSKLRGIGGSLVRCELYGKAQNGIRHFLDGEAISCLHVSTEDLFPLPSDE